MSSRKYELKRRAERQDETRRRIVQAAVELHATLGPSRSTVAAIAERAGVTRPTVYAHFPDERALLTACSGHVRATSPPPDAAAWSAISDPEERLGAALPAIYAYYRRNEQLIANLVRDVELMPVVRELAAGRAAYQAHVADVLARGWGARGRRRARLLAALAHALDFRSWQSLVARQGLSDREATDLMAALVRQAATGRTVSSAR